MRQQHAGLFLRPFRIAKECGCKFYLGSDAHHPKSFENSKKIFEYLQANEGDYTAADVAEALDLPKKTVDGAFTSAIQRKGLGVRTPAEIEMEDGSHKPVKFLSLTPAGMAFDPDATEEAAE